MQRSSLRGHSRLSSEHSLDPSTLVQDPERFASCVNTALDAIERAAAGRRGGGAGGGSRAPFARCVAAAGASVTGTTVALAAHSRNSVCVECSVLLCTLLPSAMYCRGGGSLASDSARRAFQLTTAGFVEQQPAGAAARPSGKQQQQQQQGQQGQQGERQQQQQAPQPEQQEQRERLALLGEDREQQRERDAACWAAEAAAAEREAAELRAAQEASKQEAEQQQREEAEFEAQLAAALQASLQQEAAVHIERQELHIVPPAPQQQYEQQEQQGRTPLGREVVDLTADSDGPPAKRRRCCEAEAELQGQPGWQEGSPCEVILVGSQ